MNRGSAALAAAIVLALTGCSSSTPAADSAAAKSTVTTAVPKSGAKTTAPKASATKSAVPKSGVKVAAPTVSATTRPQGKPVAGCFKVDSATGVAILAGAKPGSGAKFVKAAAVQSPYYGNMYLAAVEFSTTGVGKNVGVFAVSELTGKGLVVMSVDAKAKQFTVWQDTDHSATKISAADPYLTAAKACLK
jgi:hypothetical protein